MIATKKIILNKPPTFRTLEALFGRKMKNIFHWSADDVFRKTLQGMALLMLMIFAGIVVTLTLEAWPAIKGNGLSFIYGRTWDPVFKEYGALAFFLGTLATSFLALLISLPFMFSIALFLGEYYRKGFFASFLKSIIELLAGIPSVVYGFWGLFVIVPVVRSVEIKLGVVPYGVGILTASIVLAIMIIPYSAAIAADVVKMVPADLKEAALSLGATRYEMIKKIIIPQAVSGLFAGVLLSLGRAIGETMAVTMVIGNANKIMDSIFSPSNTMASVIANEFAEATDTLHVGSLVEIGLLLLLVTLVINAVGRYIVNRLNVVN